MEQRNEHNGNGHGNGFILGVIVGVIVTLLFTTKRGRAIVKDVTEKGIEKFSDLEKLMHDAEEKELYEEEEETEDNDYVEPKPQPKPTPEVRHIAKNETSETVEKATPKQKEEKPIPKPKKEEPTRTAVAEATAGEEKPVEKSSRGRRWFRGLRKKS